MPSNDEMSELRALLHADEPDLTAIAKKLLAWPDEGRTEAQRYAMGVIVERDLLLRFMRHVFWLDPDQDWPGPLPSVNPDEFIASSIDINGDVFGRSEVEVTFRTYLKGFGGE